MKKQKGVKKLPDGRYELRVQFPDPKTGRRVDLIRTVEAKSDIEAAYLRESLREEWLSSRVRKVERQRLKESLSAWLAKKDIAPSTRERYQYSIDHWSDVLGSYYVDAIDPEDVRETLLGWREAGLGVETINGRLRVLRTFAKDTRTLGIVESVSVLKATVHEEEADEDQGRGLSLEELRRWLKASEKIERPMWRIMLRLIALTGMRIGEAAALEWRDIDLEAGTVRIRRAVWRGIIGHPKAKASRREITLPVEIIEELRTYKRERQIDVGAITLDGIVFVSRTGGYVSNTGLRKNMLKTCRRASIDLGSRPALHCLRHTLNNLLRTSASELVRQAIIGHTDEKMGARYSKVDIEEKRSAIAAVIGMVRS